MFRVPGSAAAPLRGPIRVKPRPRIAPPRLALAVGHAWATPGPRLGHSWATPPRSLATPLAARARARRPHWPAGSGQGAAARTNSASGEAGSGPRCPVFVALAALHVTGRRAEGGRPIRQRHSTSGTDGTVAGRRPRGCFGQHHSDPVTLIANVDPLHTHPSWWRRA